MPAKTPLTRPDLPVVDDRLAWPGRSVAVFGPGALEWAKELAAGLDDARLVRVALRHAEGSERRREGALLTLHAHPDALVAALAATAADAPAITIGVGAAFAVAVEATLAVWITGGTSRLSLPPALRPIASGAHLAIEDARLETARALAADLRRRAS